MFGGCQKLMLGFFLPFGPHCVTAGGKLSTQPYSSGLLLVLGSCCLEGHVVAAQPHGVIAVVTISYKPCFESALKKILGNFW